jgi:hypothetical protein
MSDKKSTSFLDSIGSGYESETVINYDPATSEAQVGKEHEEEVAATNNWEGDTRDAVGRAASKKRRLAMKLRRIARELEAMEMDKDYKENIEDAVERAEDDVTGEAVEEGMEQELKSSSAKDEFIILQASHPLEHNPAGDDPQADMPSKTGDEWISIGPGNFDDNRDLIGRAANKKAPVKK